MQETKPYIILTVLLILLIALTVASSEIGFLQSGNAALIDFQSGLYEKLYIDSMKHNNINVSVRGQMLQTNNAPAFINHDRQIMLSAAALRDMMHCGVHISNRSLTIKKGEMALRFLLNRPYVLINGKNLQASAPMTKRNGEYYIPVRTILSNWKERNDWSFKRTMIAGIDRSQLAGYFPVKYDLREKKLVAQVKNQGIFGTCWAFAALSAMESSLLPEEQLNFSPDHMSLKNSFYSQQTVGGDYAMGMAYLTAWQGPVYEESDPYGDGVSPEGLEPMKHVQEIQLIEEKNFQKIKNAIFRFGGVQSSIYSTMQAPHEAGKYYHEEKNAYFYYGSEEPNHDITIIGWDDSYPKENFPVEPESDGAFICQNSWGTEFGEQGFFFISYYDTNIGKQNVVYTSIQDVDNYDHIYQTDLCGFVGQLGYNSDSLYAANVYRAAGNETLQAAGFYATDENTEYELYVTKEFHDTSSFQKRELVAKGSLANAGFYTIDFDKKIAVAAGEKYAIILFIRTPGAIRPIAVEFKADETTRLVDLSDGEGYISANGAVWQNVEETQSSNLCIKVYSNE